MAGAGADEPARPSGYDGGMDRTFDITLPPGAVALSRALGTAGFDALLVGGAVRDGLLGREVCDLDLVTDAPAEAIRRLADGAPGVRAVYGVGERFGTMGVALEDGAVVEVSTYRPDALPAAATAERFALDAGHRDATVNAIALDLANGTLLDPLGGVADLDAGLLRAPGEPADRFAEDPLRVLRVARLVAQLGFTVEPRTAEAMASTASRLAEVAPERVRCELTKLLVAPGATDGLLVAQSSGALATVLPEVAALHGITQPSFHDLDALAHTLQAVGLTPPTPVLRWAALLHDVGKAACRSVDPDGRIRFLGHAKEGARIAQMVCERLRFSNAEKSAIVHLVAEHMRLGEVNADNPRSVDRAVRRLDLSRGPATLASAEDALELTLADFSATAHREEAPEVRRRLATALAASRERGSAEPVRSPLSGRELMERLGLDEGPELGAVKRAVIEAVADGRIASDDKAAAFRVAREAAATGRSGRSPSP